MLALEIVFWASAGLIVYAYIGYPVVLFVLSSASQMIRDLRFIFNRADRRTFHRTEEDWPGVSIVIAAYNEEDVIAARIENCLALDYPRERLEILVGSDGSTDATNQIVASYADRGVKLANFTDRGGKISVLNRLVPMATHEFVLLSDANTMYDPGAARHLVKHFADKDVGAVEGELTYQSLSPDHKGETTYWRYEVMLKFMENKLGAILGAHGAIYAIRKSLFSPVPGNTIVDDFVIPLKIAEKGYKRIYSPEARAFEHTAPSLKAELVRRERIAAGNFQAILMLWRLLNPLRGYIAFTFFSHKILRWTAPFFMLSALAANVALAVLGPRGGLYTWLLVPQIAFYATAWLGSWPGLWPRIRRLCATQYYFVSMNVAMFRGFIKFVRGSQQVTWKKIKRYQE